MKLEDILVMWEADSAIDDHHLDRSSVDTAKLHAKYLRLLIDAKLGMTKVNQDYNTLRQQKFRYYRGEMSRSELTELNWDQWQYNKPLKNEMDEFLKGDKDLAAMQQKIEFRETIVYALEAILSQIKQRDWQIRNAITWKTFLAGN